ncbi:MAG: MerR family transcriptional regulator [Lachnotalea sp.]
MYSRGQFAIVGKVGRKTLRLYEQEGILIPQKTNEENGYHYYGDDQLTELYQIRKYRKYGLTLTEIRNIITGSSDEKEVLNQRKLDLCHEIQENINIKNQIEKQLNESKKETNAKIYCTEVDIENFPVNNILYIKERVDLENLGMSVGKLYEIAANHNLTVLGTHYVRYDNIFNEDGDFQMQTCLPVKENFEDNCSRTENDYKCLHVTYRGGFSTIGNAHQVIKKYSESNHITLAGTIFEVYNKDMSTEVYYNI